MPTFFGNWTQGLVCSVHQQYSHSLVTWCFRCHSASPLCYKFYLWSLVLLQKTRLSWAAETSRHHVSTSAIIAAVYQTSNLISLWLHCHDNFLVWRCVANLIFFDGLTRWKEVHPQCHHVGSVPNWNDAYCDMQRTLNIPPLSERRKLYKKCAISIKLFMGLLTYLMHHYCTSLALICTRYAHPLTLLQPQTRTNPFYFLPFFHML